MIIEHSFELHTQEFSVLTHLVDYLLHNVYIKSALFGNRQSISFRSWCYQIWCIKKGNYRFLELLKFTADVHVSIDNLARGAVNTAISRYSYKMYSHFK